MERKCKVLPARLTCPIFPPITFSFESDKPRDSFAPPSFIASPAAASLAAMPGLYFSFQFPLKVVIPLFTEVPAFWVASLNLAPADNFGHSPQTKIDALSGSTSNTMIYEEVSCRQISSCERK